MCKPEHVTYLHPGFGQANPERDLLPQEHVRIVSLLEERLQLLQLLRTERRPVPPLPPSAEHVLGEQIAGQRRQVRTSHSHHLTDYDSVFANTVKFGLCS